MKKNIFFYNATKTLCGQVNYLVRQQENSYLGCKKYDSLYEGLHLEKEQSMQGETNKKHGY